MKIIKEEEILKDLNFQSFNEYKEIAYIKNVLNYLSTNNQIFKEDNFLRRSGRTTKKLIRSILLAIQGKSVIFIIENNNHRYYIYNMIRKQWMPKICNGKYTIEIIKNFEICIEHDHEKKLYGRDCIIYDHTIKNKEDKMHVR